MKVLVLGAGKMTEAILLGLNDFVNFKDWGIYSPSGISSKNLASKIGAEHVDKLEDFHPDWILLGCKPQQLNVVGQTLPVNLRSALFVSMLAALSEKDQRRVLGVEKLIRIMPNLPVKYRQGVTLISSQSATERCEQFKSLFSQLGLSLVVKEEELDELTLLTGSGPAFVYEFTKNLSLCFDSLTSIEREKLARKVLLGAAMSQAASEESLDDMVNAVTSKGGVTIAVLESFRSSGLSGLIQKGMSAGKKRAEELRALIRQS